MTAPRRLVSVVESEETLRESICRAIRLEGNAANAYGDGAAAWESFGRGLPDLVVFDVATRGFEPGEFCRRLRERSQTLPIVIVLRREDDLDGALAQDFGADDYLCKPFSLRELMPRITVLLRRAGLTGGETLAWEDRPLTLGPLTVDPIRLSAHWNKRDLSLTVTEFFLLVRRAGVAKTRDQLLQDAFPGRSGNETTVNNHMARLRRRFEAIDPGFDAIEGVHGAGYRYRSGPSGKRS
jgi:DNA-binding response OmpR family regulator